MAALQPLQALNKSSGRLASFGVRAYGGTQVSYTYVSKRDQKSVTAHKFEVYLVGSSAEEYCVGFVKGSQEQCVQANQKFHSGSIWIMSKVCFDNYTGAAYISTPVPLRVDLTKTIMTAADQSHEAQMAHHPVPPRSVADVARIKTNRSTDLIAVVKHVSEGRKTKSDEQVADVTLADGSTSASDKYATIVVSVFGTAKIKCLKKSVGKPMAFFNLSVAANGRDGSPNISHYINDALVAELESPKTTSLLQRSAELMSATNIEVISAVWAPSFQSRDVSGPQPLSCAAFLDYTVGRPTTKLPSVMQLMWVHIEEPEPEAEVLNSSGERVWFLTPLRDISGSMQLGMSQRAAFAISGCQDKENFARKAAAGELNLPLLCQVRISRNLRPSSTGALQPGGSSQSVGASQPGAFVNHILEAVEPVSWDPCSAPNAAYIGVLGILNNCPAHDEGILFAFLEDIRSDPYYGMRLEYDTHEGSKCMYVAVLIASEQKSKTEKLSEDGYKVSTEGIKDIANPKGTVEVPVGNYVVIGYCSMNNLPGFRLDPPRGKQMRVALALICKVQGDATLVIHKLEIIEPDQVANAVVCLQKLRRLSNSIHQSSSEKRSHSFDLENVADTSPSDTKKARTLQAAPSDDSLPDVGKQ